MTKLISPARRMAAVLSKWNNIKLWDGQIETVETGGATTILVEPLLEVASDCSQTAAEKAAALIPANATAVTIRCPSPLALDLRGLTSTITKLNLFGDISIPDFDQYTDGVIKVAFPNLQYLTLPGSVTAIPD